MDRSILGAWLLLLFIQLSTAFFVPTSRPSSLQSTTTQLKMGWHNTWQDILQGGAKRWKVTCPTAHKEALSHIQNYVKTKSHFFVPMAGDDPMVKQLWNAGHSVTAMDLVPDALKAMRSQFDGAWTSETLKDGTVSWNHESGRVVQLEGDVLKPRDYLKSSFDAVYDKDAFGALQKEMRQDYCQRIAEYCKPDATVYMEVKLRDNHEENKQMMGPPFSLLKEDLMETNYYGNSFDHIGALGEVYDAGFGGAKQTGHVLRKR
jgi:hypothetical protein